MNSKPDFRSDSIRNAGAEQRKKRKNSLHPKLLSAFIGVHRRFHN